MSILEMTMKDLQELSDGQLAEMIHNAKCELESRNKKAKAEQQKRFADEWIKLKMGFPEARIRLEIEGEKHYHVPVKKVTICNLEG